MGKNENEGEKTLVKTFLTKCLFLKKCLFSYLKLFLVKTQFPVKESKVQKFQNFAFTRKRSAMNLIYNSFLL